MPGEGNPTGVSDAKGSSDMGGKGTRCEQTEGLPLFIDQVHQKNPQPPYLAVFFADKKSRVPQRGTRL